MLHRRTDVLGGLDEFDKIPIALFMGDVTAIPVIVFVHLLLSFAFIFVRESFINLCLDL